MNELIIEKAFARLYPGQESPYLFEVKFSGKFSPYNANVKKLGNKLTFSFSNEWKAVSEEIAIGLIQELLQKITKRKRNATTNMDLYSSFVKNLHLSARNQETDERLLRVFSAVNEQHFNNSLENPNLLWNGSSRNKLASYDYHTDTISVNNKFKDADDEILAYLLYHEMLHKKLKFSSSGMRTVHHSPEFRRLEKAFPNSEMLEKKLQGHARRKTGWLQRFF